MLQITLQTERYKVSDGHMSLVVISPPILDLPPTFSSIFVKEGYVEGETTGTAPLLFHSYPGIRKLSVFFFSLLPCCLHTTIANKLRSETHSK